jgi:hypothetical protein
MLLDEDESEECHCYSVLRGKFERDVYQSLIMKGISEGHWVVHVDITELTQMHSMNHIDALRILVFLMRKNLIVTVCKKRGGWLFLVPALKTFVAEPRNRHSAGRASLI